MKKQKLKLDELKVQSFVTDFDKTQGQTQDVNGGGTYPYVCVRETLIACPVTTTKTILTTTTKSFAGGCPSGYCPTHTTIIETIDTIGPITY